MVLNCEGSKMSIDDKNDRDVLNKPKSKSRRKIIQATPPLLLGIVNRPAWANMCSISGSMSGPHSGQQTIDCMGCTPGIWKTKPDRWPVAEVGNEIAGEEDPYTGECTKSTGSGGKSTCKYWDNSGTKFNVLFPNGTDILGISSPEYGTDLSLMQVLWIGTIGKAGVYEVLGAHIVAGLFNSAAFSDSYGYSAGAFIDLVNAALAGNFPEGISTLEGFKNQLDFMNNRGCPL